MENKNKIKSNSQILIKIGGIFLLVALVFVLVVWAASPVTDTFTDTSKIATA